MAQLRQTAITGTLRTTDNLTVTGSITNTGDITTGGNITVNGGYIYSDAAEFVLKPTSGHTQITGTVGITQTLSASGNITTAGDLAVNGGDITSTAPTLNINAGGTLNVQDNLTVQGTVSSSNNITTGGDLAVNGGDITSNASTLFISGSEQVRLQEGVFINDSGLIVSGGLSASLIMDRAGVSAEGPGAILFVSSSLSELEGLIYTDATSFQIYSYNKNLLIATTTGISSGRPAINQIQKTYEIGIGRTAVLGTSIIASGSEIVLETPTVSMPSGNISFQSGFGIDFTSTTNGTGTTTSELLSDYEEGTWTPSFSGSTGAGSFIYAAQTGRYTKIGNIVYISGYVDISSTITNSTGNMRIAGLPFDVNNTPNGNQFFMSVAWQGFTTAATNIFAAAADNGDWIDLHIQTSTTTTNSFANLLSPTDLGTGGIRFTGFYGVL